MQDDTLNILLPVPSGAILLSDDHLEGASPQALAIAALQQALAERQLDDLPLGPKLDLEDSSSRLVLNHFSIQLACTGLFHSHIPIERDDWLHESTAPQLLLAAAVDEDNLVVHFPGVLTAEEFVALARKSHSSDGPIELPLSQFQGGLDRLLTVVEVMEPEAVPRRGLLRDTAADLSDAAVAVLDWLRGQLDEALLALGAEFQPVTAGSFRSGSIGLEQGEPALAVLLLPLGLEGSELRIGPTARQAVEPLRLEVIACGESTIDSLLFRLQGEPPGSLLPDGLTLSAADGKQVQSLSAEDATVLELRWPPSELPVSLEISYRDQSSIRLEKPFLLPPRSSG